MIVSMIAAMSKNRVIGINNELPWHLPEDLAWFKKNSLNKPIIMGRKTWESLPFKPLRGRKNIIITRDSNYQPLVLDKKNEAKPDENKQTDRVALVNSIEQAIEQDQSNFEEVMIIGGASIYEQALPLCQRLYLTVIDKDYNGDAFFPDYLQYQWQQVYSETHSSKEKPHFQYNFLILDKIK